MTQAEQRLIEDKFFRYRENTKRAAELGRNRALEFLSADYTRPRSLTHRNGMENAVINAVSEAEELSRWCVVVEKTLERFHFDPREKFIKARYFQGKSITQVCDVVCISEGTYKNWRREILEIARKWAVTLNLIDGNI